MRSDCYDMVLFLQGGAQDPDSETRIRQVEVKDLLSLFAFRTASMRRPRKG